MSRLIERERTDLSGMRCSATFSPCEQYRYLLTWRWSEEPLLVAWMLNPSTATHEKLDPTIAGLVSRARAWGMGGVRVINLFAFRATDPKDMKAAADPVGPDNDAITADVLHSATILGDTVICGWGAHGNHRGRDADAIEIARGHGVALHCLDANRDGSPKHPLYIKRDMKPRVWLPGAVSAAA